MSNDHILIYQDNNQPIRAEARFKGATVPKIRTVQPQSLCNVSSGGRNILSENHQCISK